MRNVAFLSGQPRGSPKNGGNPTQNLKKNVKRKPNLGPNAKHTLNAIHAVAAPAAHRSGPAKRPLERVPPRGGSRPLERGPPRSRVPVSLERGLPRSRVPHERTCSRTRVRAFNVLTR
jgi:hypothetical protein